MTVSVCIPTYRGAAYLAETIRSVLAQTFTEFELLVVDDASPDETAAVVAQFSDARLTYLRNESNIGPQGNWNRCLATARGRYLKILPHDDVLHPACLEQQVAALDRDASEEIALVCSARQMIDGQSRPLMRRGLPRRYAGRIRGGDLVTRCVRAGTNLIGEPGAVLFRRALAERIGGFDATHPYVVDLDYWLRLLAHGDAWVCAEPLASFRVHRASWSFALSARQSSDLLGMLDSLHQRGVIRVTSGDRMLCSVRTRINQLLRLAAYRVFRA